MNTLFNKPFRLTPEPDPSRAGTPAAADVAVAEVPVSVDAAAPAAPAAAVAPAPDVPASDGLPAVNTAPSAPSIEVPAPAAPAAPSIATPAPAASSTLSIETPAPVAPGAPSIESATPATPTAAPLVTPAPAAGGHLALVQRDHHDLATPGADTGGGVTVFTRVVPSEHCPSAPRDTQRLINAIDEADPVLDQLRSLAAMLHQARTGRELRVIAVTSSVSGEGKTLLAANLALTLSRSYMRQVLLIDADLRRPNMHRLFGIPLQEGVRTALDAMNDGTPVSVQEVAPRLALLPAGKPVRDPISVLASDAMHRLMTAATSTFDWVIIDTPPVGMLPDVGLLSSLADAVLLVVEAGGVRYDLVQRTVESIGADRIFGVVLNKVPERDIVAAYGMHYYAPYR